jgi:hypothetical protein
MMNLMLDNDLGKGPSESPAVGAAMWNPWLWMMATYRCSIEMIEAWAAAAEAPNSHADKEQQKEPDILGRRALDRLKNGFAPPREIYDVRNRRQVDWTDVPLWAWPIDPEVFEVGHEG